MKRLAFFTLLMILTLSNLRIMAQTPTNELFTLDLSPDGTKIASTNLDGVLKIWDANSLVLLMELKPNPQIPQNFFPDVVWRPDNKWIAVGDINGKIFIWNVSDSQYSIGQLIRSISTNMGSLESLDWHSDGVKLAVASRGEFDTTYPTIGIWNTIDGSLISQRQAGDLNSVDWRPNTDTLSTANRNGGVNSLPVPLPIGNLNNRFGVDFPVRAVTWNTDGTKLAVGENFGGRIWIVDGGGAIIRTINAHTNAVYSLAWSADNTRLASFGGDKIIKIWNANTGELITSRQLNRQSYINSFDWSLDGTKLLFSDVGETPIWASATDLSVNIPTPSPTPCTDTVQDFFGRC